MEQTKHRRKKDPVSISTLPAPVQGYIDASNAFDTDAVTAWFAADALVNDARREFYGTDAIRRWLDREVIGDKVTMEVTSTFDHRGDIVVNGLMDGDYDKTGLPERLILTHYFTLEDDRIVRLIIIRNEPTPAWATDPAEAKLIERYFELAPQSETGDYFAQFAADAAVNDEDKDHHGIDAIRAWRSEVPPVSYTVRSIRAGEGGYDARADVAGDFPGSPVGLNFHFEFDSEGHIARLTIRA